MDSNMLSEASGPALPDKLEVGTIKNAYLRMVELYHDKEAIVCWHQKPNTFDSTVLGSGNTRQGERGLRMTYGQCHQAALCLASALVGNGHRIGDGIATFPSLAAEPMIIQWAAALLESPYIPLDPRLADNEDELRHCLTLSKPSTVIAYDEAIAKKLNNTGALQYIERKLIATPGALVGWKSMVQLMLETHQLLKIEADTDKSKEQDLATIIFTSGTTSLPKGCPHTNETLTQTMYGITACYAEAGRFLQLYPLVHGISGLSHLISEYANLCSWGMFNPRVTVDALYEEEVTCVGMVPSMLLAMKDFQPDKRLKQRGNLRVALAATMVFPEHFKIAHEHLYATEVASPYGLSEAVPTTYTPLGTETERLIHRDMVTVGWTSPGCRIKICEPGKREPLKRGQTGELHHCSRRVIKGYLGGAIGSFYDDEYGHWIATGDSAMMLEDGRIAVNGRYKDIIIRGGRNIAPAMIENAVKVGTGIDVQIIGVQDAISGEVPMAITLNTHSCEERSAIQESVLSKLGPRYAVSEVVALHDLGLEDFPKTTSGKVQKAKLAAIVQKFLDKRAEAYSTLQSRPNADAIRDVWSRVLGMAKEHLQDDLDLRQVADSLTTMQFRVQLNKSIGISLTTEQLMENYTIAAQAQILQQSNENRLRGSQKLRPGPPSIGDIVLARGDMARFKALKSGIAQSLETDLLEWDKHVEDVLPLADMHQIWARPLRPKSWNHRHAFMSKSNVEDIKVAVAKAIKSHRMFRSYGVFVEKEPVHVILRVDQEVLNQAIMVTKPVANPSEVSRVYINDHQRGATFFPGLLNKFLIVPMSSNDSVALVWIGQHSSFDGILLPLFFTTLGETLQHRRHEPSQIVDPKLWSDMYYSYKFSVQASESVAFYQSRLKNLSRWRASSWPPLKAPGYFTGDDSGWLDPVGLTVGDPSLRHVLDTDRKVAMDLPAQIVAPWDHGVTHAFPIVSLDFLRANHGIHPVTIVQSGLALAIAAATRTTAALYMNVYAARTWPFLLPQLASELPDAIGVDGPTSNTLPLLTIINPSDTVGIFLTAQQEDAQIASKHVQAPLLRLMDELPSEDAEVLESILHRHQFNWLPNLGQRNASMEDYGLERIQATHHNDMVLAWNAGMAKDSVVVLHGDFDRAQLDSQTVQGFIRLWRSAIEFVANPECWGSKLTEWLSERRELTLTNAPNGHA